MKETWKHGYVRSPWFQYSEPGLLTNKVIRNFLFQFPEPQWPHIIKLLVLYGIQGLEAEGVDFQHLTGEQLRERVVAQSRNLSIRSAEPGLRDALSSIRGQLHKFEEQLLNVKSSPLPAVANETPAAPQAPPPASPKPDYANVKPLVDSNNKRKTEGGRKKGAFPFNYEVHGDGSTVHFYRVKHGPVDMTAGKRADPRWRLGDEKPLSIFEDMTNNRDVEIGDDVDPESTHPDAENQVRAPLPREPVRMDIYPGWWGHAEHEPSAKPTRKPARPNPRLAYSVPPEPSQPAVHDVLLSSAAALQDDLVTAEYLQVPSRVDCSNPAPTPAAAPTAVTAAAAPEPVAAAAAVKTREGKGRNPAKVESKIKNLIHADRFAKQRIATQRREAALAVLMRTSKSDESGRQDGTRASLAEVLEGAFNSKYASNFMDGGEEGEGARVYANTRVVSAPPEHIVEQIGTAWELPEAEGPCYDMLSSRALDVSQGNVTGLESESAPILTQKYKSERQESESVKPAVPSQWVGEYGPAHTTQDWRRRPAVEDAETMREQELLKRQLARMKASSSAPAASALPPKQDDSMYTDTSGDGEDLPLPFDPSQGDALYTQTETEAPSSSDSPYALLHATARVKNDTASDMPLPLDLSARMAEFTTKLPTDLNLQAHARPARPRATQTSEVATPSMSAGTPTTCSFTPSDVSSADRGSTGRFNLVDIVEPDRDIDRALAKIRSKYTVPKEKLSTKKAQVNSSSVWDDDEAW